MKQTNNNKATDLLLKSSLKIYSTHFLQVNVINVMIISTMEVTKYTGLHNGAWRPCQTINLHLLERA